MTRDSGASGTDVADVGPRPVAIFGSFRYGQYFEDLLAGVVAAADAADSSVISIQTSEGVLPSAFEDLGQQAVSRAAWTHFDGAIVVLKAVSPDFVARLRAAGKFVVAVGQERRGTHAAVTIDNAGGVRDAVSHLHEHGHVRIGFLSPGWQTDSAERYAAYRDRMTQLGLPVLPLLGGDLMDREQSRDQQGYLAGCRFAVGERLCTALIIGCDPEALGFMRAIQEAGLRIPEDLAVIGIDDVAEAAVAAPPLATIAISFARVGQTAFDVALRGGRGEAVESRHLVPERLVPRESCGCSHASSARLTGEAASPVEAMARVLGDASQDSAIGPVAHPDVVASLAGDVVDALSGRTQDADPRQAVMRGLASRIVDLCPLDRSVQAAMRAIRAVADARARMLAQDDTDRLWALSEAVLDLCDLIRSGQLQRRMSEYVELKRLQVAHYFIGNSLLGHNRDELRSLDWLAQTPADAGALGLWSPPGQTDHLLVRGGYERHVLQQTIPSPSREPRSALAESMPVGSVPVESFPPRWLLRDARSGGRLVVITQVRFEDADWGLLAVAGGRILQSSLVQETFQQWSILMSTSLSAEKADAELARQAEELTAAYQKELALIEEVRVSEERYALAAEAAQDALWDWDIASDTAFYSTQWKALLGHRDHEIGESPREWLDRIHPDDRDTFRAQMDEMWAGNQPYLNIEHRLRTAAGEYRWIACRARCVVDDDGRPARIVGSVSDVTVRRLLQDQLMQEARFDALTGLATRTLFRERLCDAFEVARRDPHRSFAVLFIDLNGFKGVNDTLGHAAGDQLLSNVAKRLSAALRRGDTAARLGGDEFAVLLNANDHQVPRLVERIDALIREPHHIGGRTVTVGAAIGVAVSSRGYESADDMLHDADSGMYRAKRIQRAQLST